MATADQLAALSIFRGVPRDHLVRLLEVSTTRLVPRDMVALDEGEVGSSVLVVVSGRFRVDLRGAGNERHVLAEVGPGALLGETALFRKSIERSARALALEDSEVVRIENDQFEGLAAEGNRVPLVVERAVLTTLVERVQSSRAAIDDYFQHLQQAANTPPSVGLFARLRQLLGGR